MNDLLNFTEPKPPLGGLGVNHRKRNNSAHPDPFFPEFYP
jgi:hypothetical protein